MSETKTTVIDATSKILQRYREEDGLIRLDSHWEPEKKAEILKWVSELWIQLQKEIEIVTGEVIPNFDESLIDWVQFEGERGGEVLGDNNLLSGRIRLNAVLMRNEEIVARTLCHELFHFISRRKILERDNKPVVARGGLSMIGNKLFRRDSNSNIVDTFENRTVSLAIVNEAVVETLSAKVLTKIAPNIAALKDKKFEPQSYGEARRFYTSLIENIVLAWNEPHLRQLKGYKMTWEGMPSYEAVNSPAWKARFIKLQNELELSDNVSYQQIEEIFEKATWEKEGVHKISKLINTLLGEGAFQQMLTLTKGLKPGDPKSDRSYTSLWRIIAQPTEAKSKDKRDTKVDFLDTSIEIKKEEIPEYVAVSSYDREDGHIMGIQEVFSHYEKLIQHPYSKDELTSLALLAYSDYKVTNPASYFGSDIFYIPANINGFSTITDSSMEFCFAKFKEQAKLNMSNPQVEIKKIRDVEFLIEYFPCGDLPGILLAKVELKRHGYTRTFFFCTKE